MSTTSHPLHRELPHADDELMTIKGGGHTRPGPGSDAALLAPPRHTALRFPFGRSVRYWRNDVVHWLEEQSRHPRAGD